MNVGTMVPYTLAICRSKQFIAVVTGGQSLVGEGYAEQFGGPYKSMEKDTGSLVVYAVE
jgi:alcohol dehydrogenase (cytochrome c)